MFISIVIIIVYIYICMYVYIYIYIYIGVPESDYGHLGGRLPGAREPAQAREARG